ncbi:hypothetical protein [Micromonospora peucetia]|uniref:Uncharacterized protein n=1 Tax=Micromonospora peucetia TaxID=47871 RepID=A0A1C6USZ5_9ACTN|nr:hypothetical protein [Micromonospora peucetia]WSA34772.1 hypothetical protein OIE14_12365 [Micromonospora peucetia]SCL57164.1 hypothetical protein GA0070608_1777 [Micromonospora peucetia]
MSYRTIFREAVGEIPPTSIDVDRVIARQRRAGKLHRWGACGAGAAAVLAVAVTAALLLPGAAPRTTEAAGGQKITTAPGTPEDLARLDNAVFAALKREAPGMKWVHKPSPLNPGPKTDTLSDTPAWDDSDRMNTLVGYAGSGWMSVDGVEGLVMVRIERDATKHLASDPCEDLTPNSTCRESDGPNGERLVTVDSRKQEQSRDGRRHAHNHRRIHVFRPDGTVLSVSLQGYSLDGSQPLTAEEQAAVALDPAIALAPLPPGVVPPSPTPRPSLTKSAEQKRIDDAVFASLRRQAPDVMGAGGATASPVDLASVWRGSGSENNADSYWGQGRILVGKAAGLFSVQIHRQNPGLSGDMTCGKPTRTYACTAGKGPDGERHRTVTNTTRNGSKVSAERGVHVLRKDGSWLAVTLTADLPDARFALTVAQQQAVAFDPAVALAGR